MNSITRELIKEKIDIIDSVIEDLMAEKISHKKNLVRYKNDIESKITGIDIRLTQARSKKKYLEEDLENGKK